MAWDDAKEQEYQALRAQLAARPTAPTGPKQNTSALGDFGTDIKRGIQKVPGAVTGLLDIPVAAVSGRAAVSEGWEGLGELTGFQPGKWADEAQKQYSPGRQAAMQEAQQATGVADTAKAYLTNPSMLVGTVLESLPSVALGGVYARGLNTARGLGATGLSGVVRGGIGEGAVMAGHSMESMIDEGADPRTAAGLASMVGVGGGALGVMGGRLAERMGLIDPDTLVAGGVQAAGAAARQPMGLARRVAGGAFTEGVFEEAPQTMLETVAGNVAVGREWDQDLAKNATVGALAGGLMGGVFNIPGARRPVDVTNDAPPADTDLLGDTAPPDAPEAGTPFDAGALRDEYASLTAQAKALAGKPEQRDAVLARMKEIQGSFRENGAPVEALNIDLATKRANALDKEIERTTKKYDSQLQTAPDKAAATAERLTKLQGDRAALDQYLTPETGGQMDLFGAAPAAAPVTEPTPEADPFVELRTAAPKAFTKSGAMSKLAERAYAEYSEFSDNEIDLAIDKLSRGPASPWRIPMLEFIKASRVQENGSVQTSEVDAQSSTSPSVDAQGSESVAPVRGEQDAGGTPVTEVPEQRSSTRSPLGSNPVQPPTDLTGAQNGQAEPVRTPQGQEAPDAARQGQEAAFGQERNADAAQGQAQPVQEQPGALAYPERPVDDTPDNRTAFIGAVRDYFTRFTETLPKNNQEALRAVFDSFGQKRDIASVLVNARAGMLDRIREQGREPNRGDMIQIDKKIADMHKQMSDREDSPIQTSLRAAALGMNVSHVTVGNRFNAAMQAINDEAAKRGLEPEAVLEMLGLRGPQAIEFMDSISEAEAAQMGLSYRRSGPRVSVSRGADDFSYEDQDAGFYDKPRDDVVEPSDTGKASNANAPVADQGAWDKQDEPTVELEGFDFDAIAAEDAEIEAETVSVVGANKEDVAAAIDEWNRIEAGEGVEWTALNDADRAQWVRAFLAWDQGMLNDRMYREVQYAISSRNENTGATQSDGLTTEPVGDAVPERGTEGTDTPSARERPASGRPETASQGTDRAEAQAEPAAEPNNPLEARVAALREKGLTEGQQKTLDRLLASFAERKIDFERLTDEIAALEARVSALVEPAAPVETSTTVPAVSVARKVKRRVVKPEAETTGAVDSVTAGFGPVAVEEARPDFQLEPSPQGDTQATETVVDEGHLAPNDRQLELDLQPRAEPKRGATTLVEAMKSAKTAPELARWLVENAQDQSIRILMRKIVPLLSPSTTVHVAELGEQAPSRVVNNLLVGKGAHYHNWNTGESDIWFRGESFTTHGMTEETAAHELLHAATMTRLKFGNLRRNENTPVGKATVDLIDLRNHIVKHYNAQVKAGTELPAAVKFAVADVDELLAWGLTNPRVQEYLRSIPYKASSVWNEFVELLRKLLGLSGRESNALDALLDKATALLEADSLGPQQLGGKDAAMGTAEMRPQRIDFGTDPTPQGFFDTLKDKVSDLATNPKQGLQQHGLGWLTLEQLAERVKSAAVAKYNAVMVQIQKGAKDIVSDAAAIDVKWARLTDAQQKALSNVMRTATRLQFDPAKAAPANPEEVALKEAYDRLQPAASGVYTEVRDFYDGLFKQRKKILLDAAAKGAKGGKNRLEVERTFAGLKGPYFPLKRLGNWYSVGMSPELKALVDSAEAGTASKADLKRIELLKKSDKHYITRGHQTAAEAKRAAKALEADLGVAYFNTAKVHIGAEMASIPDIEKINSYLAADLPKEVRGQVRDMLSQMYFDMLESHSALKSQMKRKNYFGEEEDMRRVFSSTATAQAHHISRLRYSNDLAESMVAVQKEGSHGNILMRNVYNELVQRTKLALERNENPFVDRILQFSYFTHLGLSPAFWLTNMSQVITTTLPWLSARHGVGTTGRAMASAYGDVVKMLGDTYRGKGWKDGWRSEFDWSQRFADGTGESRLFRDLLDRNLLDITMEHDLTAVAEMRYNRKIDDAIKIANMPVRVTEIANRAVTGLAAYRMKMASLAGNTSMTQEQKINTAIEHAAKAVSETQLNYSSLNTARHMQSVMGSKSGARLIMQFRKYQQGMLYLIGASFNDAFRGKGETDAETKRIKREARRTLIGMFATTGMLAGVVGMPLVGTVAAVINAVANARGDDDEPYNLEVELRNYFHDLYGKEVSDAIMLGLPTLINTDLSRRVGLGTIADPLPFARSKRTVDDTAGSYLFAASGPAMDMTANMFDGMIQMAGGDVAKGLEKVIPVKAVANSIRAYRFNDEGMTDRNGNIIQPAEKFDAWDLTLRAMGFQSMKESDYYSGNEAIQTAKTAVTDKRNALIRNYANAVVKGEDVTEARAEIAAFNQRNPTKGLRIERSGTLRAVQARRKMTTERNDVGIRVGKAEAPFAERARFASP